MNITIMGCGDVGLRCATLLRDQHHITAGKRNISSLPEWIDARRCDVGDPSTLGWLATDPCDILIYALAAAAFNDADYRLAYVDGVANVVTALNGNVAAIKRVLFVSSTGVYHQNDGSLVDETSTTQPERFNGQRMLEGEAQVLATGKGTVVRFSGIYGPGRLRMINRVASGNFTPAERAGLTNRIHVDDCAAVLAHLISQQRIGDLDNCYLASDNCPATTTEVESFIAAELGLQYAPKEREAVSSSGRIAGSKRCSNARLRASGYQFLYPDFRAGYRQLIHTR